MPNTPSQRTTRANSNTQSLSLNDIKTLIDSSKNEILTAVKDCNYDSVKDEVKKFCVTTALLVDKMQKIDDTNKELESKIKKLEKILNMEHERGHDFSTDDIIYETEECRNKLLVQLRREGARTQNTSFSS